METEDYYWLIVWLIVIAVIIAGYAVEQRIKRYLIRRTEQAEQRKLEIQQQRQQELEDERKRSEREWKRRQQELEDERKRSQQQEQTRREEQQLQQEREQARLQMEQEEARREERQRQQERDQARQQMEEERHSKIQGLTQELLQFQWGLKACSHCGELKFYVAEMSSSGKSMKCLCAHCWKPQVVKSRAIDTSRAVEIYYEIKRSLSSPQLSTFQPTSGVLMVRVNPPESAPVQTDREHIPESVRHEVWRRDEGHCVKCGSQENLEFDHIIPHSKGGADTVRNLQLLCQTCNRTKGASI